MIKRVIEISSEPMHLSVKLDQLHLRRHEPTNDLVASIPCEDIGMVVVDHTQATYSHYALGRLMDFGAAVVVCGRDHLPNGILIPLSNHTEVVWRINDQISASKPTLKRLWKQVVTAKVRAQAANLAPDTPAHRKLVVLAKQVRSGDPANIEAQAAKAYWAAWLDPVHRFKRDTNGDGINALLNYGYAILRAAVARAIVSAGLQPAIGIHHANRSNAFCLADDLIEPLRPVADDTVSQLVNKNRTTLGRDEKKALLGLMHRTTRIGDDIGPLMTSLHRYTASFARCLRGEDQKMLIPTALTDEET